MSLLAAHFDVSGATFYVQKGKKSAEIIKFPYVYSKGILSNQCTRKEFCKYLIEKVLTDRGIKPSTCDILICGFMDPPDIGIKTKFSVGIVDIIENSEDFIPVFINGCSFITKGVISARTNCEERLKIKEASLEELDHIANLSVFPHVVSQDMSSQTNADEEIVKKIPEKFRFESGRKLVFTGGRFSQDILNEELNYILILDSLRGHGIFDIHLDRNNFYPIFKTMQMYDRDLTPDFQNGLENVGTFIRTGGSTECLLSTGIGNDQFIEIEDNKIFVLPLRLDNPAKLSIKSHVLGTIDIRTTGGNVGVVFDTRVGDNSLYSDVKIFNDCLKQFTNVLKNK